MRATAIAKGDVRIIAIVSRELVAAEACYIRSCYTRTDKVTSTNTSTQINESDAESNQDTYGYTESQGYKKLFEFIRFDLLENPILITMVELRKLLPDYMRSLGAIELRESTKKNFRRKLEFEFGDLLQYEDLLDNNRLCVILNNLSPLKLAKTVAKLSQELENKNES